MTNFEIITKEAIRNGIYTKEEAEAIISQGYRLPLHTFAEWKALGYSVRKGERAKMTCQIWKYNEKATAKQNTDNNESEPEENGGHYYLTKAFFFTDEQVEKRTADN